MSQPPTSTPSRPKRRVPGKYLPQENPKWTQHKGPFDTSYEKDITKRRKKRNDRRKGLFAKARELVSIAGGRIFIRYVDENDKSWTLSTDEAEYSEYISGGLSVHQSEALVDNSCPEEMPLPDEIKKEIEPIDML